MKYTVEWLDGEIRVYRADSMQDRDPADFVLTGSVHPDGNQDLSVPVLRIPRCSVRTFAARI